MSIRHEKNQPVHTWNNHIFFNGILKLPQIKSTYVDAGSTLPPIKSRNGGWHQDCLNIDVTQNNEGYVELELYFPMLLGVNKNTSSDQLGSLVI